MNEQKANSEFHLRPATTKDAQHIKTFVRSENLNPLKLDWPRFVIAETSDREIIGCVQVKAHRDGSLELASLVVVSAWRGRGVARDLIQHMLDLYPGELYLTCRSGLEPFYQKFGFRTIQYTDMPPYFQRIWRLANAMIKIFRSVEKLLVMGKR
jgi:amino-acid N-acetyltransferase